MQGLFPYFNENGYEVPRPNIGRRVWNCKHHRGNNKKTEGEFLKRLCFQCTLQCLVHLWA